MAVLALVAGILIWPGDKQVPEQNDRPRTRLRQGYGAQAREPPDYPDRGWRSTFPWSPMRRERRYYPLSALSAGGAEVVWTQNAWKDGLHRGVRVHLYRRPRDRSIPDASVPKCGVHDTTLWRGGRASGIPLRAVR